MFYFNLTMNLEVSKNMIVCTDWGFRQAGGSVKNSGKQICQLILVKKLLKYNVIALVAHVCYIFFRWLLTHLYPSVSYRRINMVVI